MKYSVLFMFYFTLSSSLGLAGPILEDPCPIDAVVHPHGKNRLTNFGNFGIKLGVSAMEDAVKNEVEKSIASLKVTTIGFLAP